MRLDMVMKYVKQIDGFIKSLRQGMRHVHPHSVDALRSHLSELEKLRDALMDSELRSGENLDDLMWKIRTCVQECLRPVYAGKPRVLPKPITDPYAPPPPVKVEVPGVNLILVVDASHSMIPELKVGGRIHNTLVRFADNLAAEAKKASIPATVSLVWYGDPTSKANQPNFYWVAKNKVSVSQLPDALSGQFPVTRWKKGIDYPESGMSAIHRTLASVVDPSVENTLILVSDDWQKLDGSSKPSRLPYFKEVTLKEVTDVANKLKVRNRYALLPSGKTANVAPFFKEIKNYDYMAINYLYIKPWVGYTLRPSTAPKK